MPKSTFFNLSEDKRRRIIDAAHTEFAVNTYENVTVAKISSDAQIPVGSFYQYFYDKDDLYLYLFMEIELRVIDASLKLNEKYPNMKESLVGEYLTEKELAFYDTWYHVPDDVMRKFYFGEYDDQLFEMCRVDLEDAKKEGRLLDHGNMEFVLFWYVTATFNLYMYCKKNKIEDEKERLELKSLLFNQIIAHGIFK